MTRPLLYIFDEVCTCIFQNVSINVPAGKCIIVLMVKMHLYLVACYYNFVGTTNAESDRSVRKEVVKNMTKHHVINLTFSLNTSGSP